MYETWTDRAQKAMQLANQEAMRFNHEYIGTEHILLGLVKEGSGVGCQVLRSFEIDLRKVRLAVDKLVAIGPDRVMMGKLPQSPAAKKVIEYAMAESSYLGHNYTGTEHMLLGILREQEGVAAKVLMKFGLAIETVRERTMEILGHSLGGETAYDVDIGRQLSRTEEARASLLAEVFEAAGCTHPTDVLAVCSKLREDAFARRLRELVREAVDACEMIGNPVELMRLIMKQAQEIACASRHSLLMPAHILLVLCNYGMRPAADMLKELSVTDSRIRNTMRCPVDRERLDSLPLDAELSEIFLVLTASEAWQQGRIDALDVLEALVHDEKGQVAHILRELRVPPEALQAMLRRRHDARNI